MRSLLIIISLLGAMTAFSKELKCHTPNFEHEFTLKDKSVVFHTGKSSYGFDSKRKISSVDKVRTVPTAKGVKKWLNFNGKDYKIEIDNLTSPNSINDYVTISMGEKYRVSYPLTCR